MAFVTSGDARIYWSEQGEGEPAVLIMGLAYSSAMWHRVAPRLAERYRIILLDNRGVGQSDVPKGPYRISQMADDAVAVMDAAGIEKAHILGASMGGMIAQELTLRHPERVRSLCLGCSSSRGLNLRGPDWVHFGRQKPWKARTLDERLWSLAPMLYHPQTSRELICEDYELLKRAYPTLTAYANQLLGILLWSSRKRLHRIAAPTLVVHGDSDKVLGASNGRELARLIPNAEFAMIEKAGHVFSTDQPEAGLAPVLKFLQRHSRR